MVRFALLLALLSTLALGGVTEARGQEGGETEAVAPDTARQDTTAQDTLPPPRPPFLYVPAAVSVTVTVGRPGAGPLQTQPVLVRQSGFYGAPPDTVRLARQLQVEGGLFAGVSTTVSLAPSWAVNFGLGVARAEVRSSYQADVEAFDASAAALAGASEDLTAFSAETTLRYRIPSTRRVQPFLELGGAVSRWSLKRSLPVATELSSGVTRVEAVAAVGAVVPLNHRFSARIRASSRVLRTPSSPQAPGETLATVPKGTAPTLFRRRHSLLVQTELIPHDAFGDSAREILTLLRIEVGISLDLGRTDAASAGPVAPSAPTSPPGR